MGEVIPFPGVEPPLRPGTGEARALSDPEASSRYASAAAGPDEEPSPFTPIEDASLRALGRRGMSRRELERELARQGFHEYAIADELDRLERVGLIDDYALAQHLVAHLQERRGLVGSAIQAELVRRIIAPGAISYAMDLVGAGDEVAQARELALKRARQYGALDRATMERRLTAFLVRRGFSTESVRIAVAAARQASA